MQRIFMETQTHNASPKLLIMLVMRKGVMWSVVSSEVKDFLHLYSV